MKGLSINVIALRTLFVKEVRRFMKVWKQTVFGPLVNISLYFLVFGVALGSRLKNVGGVPYIEFVVPGLMMLAMISNAFSNTSSSLFQARINGTIVDVLVSPIGAPEMLMAYVGASIIRSFIVGFMVLLVATLFNGFRMEQPGWVLFFSVFVPSAFAMVGLVNALWAEKFDHLNIVPSFIMTPLIFLGGVFYTIDMLPEPWQTVSRFNPMLYMVNGMRHGILGVSDVPLTHCIAWVLALNVVLFAICGVLLSRGYKLRA